jgi:hypothetical protein
MVEKHAIMLKKLLTTPEPATVKVMVEELKIRKRKITPVK